MPALHLLQVTDQRRKIQRADVLGEVHRLGVVRRMALDGVRVVVDARYHLGTLPTVHRSVFNATRCTTGSTKEINI